VIFSGRRPFVCNIIVFEQHRKLLGHTVAAFFVGNCCAPAPSCTRGCPGRHF